MQCTEPEPAVSDSNAPRDLDIGFAANAGLTAPVGYFGRCPIMRTARNIIRIVGGVGFWLWPFLCGLAWLFRGFKPGGPQGGLSTYQGWLCVIAPTVAFIYYLCLADMHWSRRLFVVGIITQVALVMATITLVAFTDGGFLVAPLLLVGPVAWLVYVLRVRDAKHVG